MSIYSEMIQAYVEVEHHECGLCVKADPTSEAILANHGHKPGGMLPYSFIYQGDLWYEIPTS